MKVLVTGATGFVGSHVVRHLVDEGHEVAAMVRETSNTDRLEEVLPRVTVIHGDIGAPDSWRSYVARWGPEACVHAAWYTEPGRYLDSPQNISDLRHSLALLEELASAGCRNIVMTGTCFEYATSDDVLREDSRTAPKTLYAACKLALGLVAAQRAAQLGVRFAWGRIFYVYGTYEDPRRLVPALTLALLRGKSFDATTGEQMRDYLDVDDAAAGLASLAVAGSEGVYNVCSSAPTTLGDLMLEVGRMLGLEDLIRFGARPAGQNEPPFIAGDNLCLREATGWRPTRSLKEGLARTVEWWKAREQGTD